MRWSPVRETCCRSEVDSRGSPEAFVYLAGLVFEEWTGDDDRLLPAGKDFAAGQVEGGILLVAAGITHEAGFRQGEDDAA